MHAGIFKLYYTVLGGVFKMCLRNIHYCINHIKFCLSETEIQAHKKRQKVKITQ